MLLVGRHRVDELERVSTGSKAFGRDLFRDNVGALLPDTVNHMHEIANDPRYMSGPFTAGVSALLGREFVTPDKGQLEERG